MAELSERLAKAIFFLERSGYAKNHSAIARRLGVSAPTITMTMNGSRTPTWDLLLKFCDAYPISFEWLRTGKGEMVKGEGETALLKRIAELEEQVRLLTGQGVKPK